jgi:light-regulated signal transduction histidine kinase (bacteriophytochrome)
MKPILSKSQDNDSLQALGRASVQIVHDLKNQLNGLKLYATFLRKRLEKSARPEDEMETINKLIAGLDRAAGDLSMLVQYGRPIELRKQVGVDVQKIMRTVAGAFSQPTRTTGPLTGAIIIEAEPLPLTGEFDPTILADALKSISVGAMKMRGDDQNRTLTVSLRRDKSEEDTAVIEWHGLVNLDHDPFRSFAGSDEIRMSFAAKVIEAHGGSAEQRKETLSVRLPLTGEQSN